MKSIQELKNELREAKEKAYKNAKTKKEVIEIWEQDKRSGIPKECKRLFCSGCRQNFYNCGGGGVKECWGLNKAKLKEREIYSTLNSIKPDKVITLSCYTQEYH